MPALQLLFRYVVAERIGTIILSAIVAHTAWHWMMERWSDLSRFDWPVMTAAGLAGALRWLMGLVLLAGLVWLVAVVRTGPPCGATRHRTADPLIRLLHNLQLVVDRLHAVGLARDLDRTPLLDRRLDVANEGDDTILGVDVDA